MDEIGHRLVALDRSNGYKPYKVTKEEREKYFKLRDEYDKKYNEWKSIQKPKIKTEESVSSGAATAEGEVPGAAPVEPEGVKKRVLTERAYEGDIREKVKTYLEEKGLTREEVSQETRSAQAKQMVDDLGEDAAVEAVRTNQVKGALASATLFDVIKRVDERMVAAKNEADMDVLAQKQADLIEMLNDRAFEAGEFNSQFAREYIESDIGWNKEVKKHEYVKKFGSISPEVEAKFEALDAEMKDLRVKLADAEKRAAEAADKATIETIKTEAEKKKPKSDTEKELAKKKIAEGRAELASAISRLTKATVGKTSALVGFSREQSAALGDIFKAVAKITKGGIQAIKTRFKKEVSPYMDADTAWSHVEEKYAGDFKIDSVGKLKVPKSLIRDLVAGGIDNVPDLVAAVREEMGLETESDREIRDAITEYEKVINMTKDDIGKEVSRLKTVGKLLSKIEDAMNGIMPQRTGLQRPKFTEKQKAEIRALEKELRERIKDLPSDVQRTAKQLLSALDAKKNRRRNRIADLQKAIREKKRIVQSKKDIGSDAELAELEKKLKIEEENYENAFAEVLMEERDARSLSARKRGLLGQIENLEAAINSKQKIEKVKRSKKEDDELNDLIKERDRLKKIYEDIFSEKPIPLTAGEKRIASMEAQLEKLLAKDLPTVKEGVSYTKEEQDRIEQLQDEIFDAKDKAGLLSSKRTQEQVRLDRLDDAIAKTEELIKNNDLEFKKKEGDQVTNNEIEAKKSILKESLDQLKSLREQAGIFEKRRLESAKKSIKKSIAELEKRLADKDFAKKERKPLLEDSELIDLRAEKLRIREEYDSQAEAEKPLTALNAKKNRIKNRIEDIRKAISENKKIERSQRGVGTDAELEALESELKTEEENYRNAFADLLNEEKERKRLESAKKSTKKSIAELGKRLAVKYFAKKERKPLLGDSELIYLRAEKLRIREEYDKEFYKAELANRTKWQKLGDIAVEAWSVGRAVNAGIDLSMVGVQAAMLTIDSPKNAVEAFREAARAMRSEENALEALRYLKSLDFYPLAKQSGIKISEVTGKMTAREELQFGKFMDIMWDVLMFPSVLAGKKSYTFAKSLNPFKATERFGAIYLDFLRMNKFRDMLDGDLRGKSFSENKKDFQSVADGINTLSSRASLGPLEQAAPFLTHFVYSPRNWATQIKLFSPYSLVYFSRMTPTARKMVFLTMGKFIAFNLSTLALYAAYAASDDDDETGVELDPRSSDFLKFRDGKIRQDFWGGKMGQVVFFCRMMADLAYDAGIGKGGFKNKEGEVLPLGMPHKTPGMDELIINQVINKQAPQMRLLWNYYAKRRTKDGLEDKYGNEYSFYEDAQETYRPMFFSTVVDLAKDGIDVMDPVRAFLSYIGMSMYIEEDKKKKKKKKK